MLFRVPKYERRTFNYKPRYYRPAESGVKSDGEDVQKETEAMHERIRHGLERQKKHHRMPVSSLWIFALVLFLLLLLMTRL